ncbi:MAG: hypothetical protein M1819_004153 [Sarea resinae]|nr:MAG: hypothetical protein M1819_004153 [Sarea resinae]
MAQSTPDETTTLLTRLSQKPGVQSTLILSRSTGAIVRTSGLISTAPAPNSNATLPSPSAGSANDLNGVSSGSGSNDESSSRLATGDASNGGRAATGGGMKSAEEVARMVWAFVGAAGDMVEGLRSEGGEDDEVKLLRLRTRRNELVIVPGKEANLLPREFEQVGMVANVRLGLCRFEVLAGCDS